MMENDLFSNSFSALLLRLDPRVAPYLLEKPPLYTIMHHRSRESPLKHFVHSR